MAKILFISPFPLFPSTGGNRVRTLTMLHAVEAMGHEAHFALMPSRQMGGCDEAAHRAYFGARFHPLRRAALGELVYLAKRLLGKLRRMLRGTAERLSSVDETYFPGFTKQLRALDQAQRYDAAIVQYVGFSRALEAFGKQALRLIDTHDSFAGQMPRHEERRGMLRADRIIAIQEREAHLFRDLVAPAAERVVTISHFIESCQPVPTGECAGAAFIGSDFPQNNVSLAWFIGEVLPLIRARAPDFVLKVAGTVGRAVPDAEGVHKLGVVPDLGAAFAQAPILVNAITRGTGVKIKLLEAFGAGVPVVSTALGVEGIAEQHLRGCLVAPDGDAQAFADATLTLYRDAALRAQLARANATVAQEWNAAQRAVLACVLGDEALACRAA